MQLGEVAIERAKISTLYVNVRAAAKHDRAKAVPLGLEQEPAGGRDLVRQFREHRFDRRRDVARVAGRLRWWLPRRHDPDLGRFGGQSLGPNH